MSFHKLRTFTKTILIAINFLMSQGLIIGCYGKYFTGEKLWFTGLFTLGSFYFLLFILAFFFFWIFAKPVFSLLSIGTVLICWQPLKHLVQIRLSPNFILQKHPSNIRVMSWNVEHFDILEHKTHPERKQQMIDMINSYQPDVACFQEVVAGEKPKSINNLQQIMNQLGFTYYHYSFNPKLDFDENHHFGIIIFSRLPIINKSTVSFAPNDYNSIFQYVDVVRAADTFRVFNIHLQSLKFSDKNRIYLDEPTLKDQQDLIRTTSIISKLRTGFLKRSQQSNHIRQSMDSSKYPVIVCGDLNDVPNSYSYFIIGEKMKNAFAEKGTGIGRTFYSVSPTLRIDDIFCDERFSVQQFVRVKKKLSDHYPLIADLFYTSSAL